MFRRIFSYALLSGLALSAVAVQAQTVDPRQPPQALPVGSYFPPTVAPPPQIAPPSTMPVEYLPSEMGSLVSGEDEFVPRLWMDTEAILWQIRKGTIAAPLVTTGPASTFGLIGQAGTRVLTSNQIDYDTMVGARLMMGVWYNDSHTCGLEGGFTWFGNHDETQTFRSDITGNPVISRPFRDAATGRESVRAVALPGAFTGNVTVSSNFSAYAGEISPLVVRLSSSDRFYIYGMMGFKYFGMNEQLLVADQTTALAGGQINFSGRSFGPGTRLGVTDVFDASNDLYGGILGARFGFDRNRFFMDTTAKLGLMHNDQVLVASGGTTIRNEPFFRRPGSAPLGLLVGPFNARRESQAAFAIMPEVNMQLGYQLTTRISLLVSYNFLYISSVVRPGDQVVRTVNGAVTPSNPTFGANVQTRQPTAVFIRDEFTANGVSFGLSLRY
jgi:hypothetical protein